MVRSTVRHIGVAEPPKKSCDDVHCPFHGHLSVRGRVLEGTVVSTKAIGTVIVQHNFLSLSRKYRRYEKKFTKVSAHKPACIDVEVGDIVRVGECRPISKTIAFVVIEKVEKEE
ncbi:MAG: 30S ribosomal protein S17 [Promethearchaeota archaeon]